MPKKIIIGHIFMQLINDFHEMERHFFSLISLHCVDYQTITAFATGVLASGLNPAFVTQINEHFLNDLAQCKSYFTKNNLPWALIISEQLLTKKNDQLLQEYELADTGVGMAFNLLSNNLHAIESPLEFKLMNEELHTWSIPIIHGFQSTPEITHIYTLRHSDALKKCDGVYHFSGFLAGEPVVSMTLTVKEHLARIDDLATHPNVQQRGFASAMMTYALQKALELNVRICFLEASSAGLNLYKRIGFQPLFTNHYYEL